MTSLGSLNSKKPRIYVKTVYEKQNRNLDLQLKLLKTRMSNELYQFDKNEEEE